MKINENRKINLLTDKTQTIEKNRNKLHINSFERKNTMDKMKIHTLELSYTITSKEYDKLEKYFYSTKKECYPENKMLKYLGFKDKGIRIHMLR